MDVPQRRRLFELGEATIAEAVLDVLRAHAPEYLTTSQVVEALELPAWTGGMTQNPERSICEGVLTRLIGRGHVDRSSKGQAHTWRYVSQ